MTHQPGGYRIDLENRTALQAMCLTPTALTAALSQTFSRPAEIDPRPWFKIRNQSSEGSCQGHAQAAAGEQVYYCQAGKAIRFSSDAAYYLAQKQDNITGDRGSTISGGMKVAKTIGHLEEQYMPYTPKYNPGDIPPNYANLMGPYKVQTAATLTTFAQIVDWLAQGIGGVWWGTSWSVQPNSRGEITRWSNGGGGHATALMGYTAETESDGYPKWLWLANSWGTAWGIEGWAKVHRDAVNDALRQQYTVVAGISDMKDIKPRKVDWRKENVF
jgi:hypothetical protein